MKRLDLTFTDLHIGHFTKLIIYVYYAAIRNRKSTYLWNMSPDLDDLSVVTMVFECADVNGVVAVHDNSPAFNACHMDGVDCQESRVVSGHVI